MGNSSSRNDHLPIPPGFMPPNYPGYSQLTKSSSWNPFKRNKMKKREQALREYLYTTPMILQYPNAIAVAQPGQNLVQHGIPQIHSAIPVPANGFAAQPGIPFGASMAVPAAGDPQAAAATANGAPVIPSQMAPMAYPAAMDYSAYPDLRSAMASFFPRRSRRSQRHHNRSHHRSRRRSSSPSSESSITETASSSYGSPSSYDSTEYPRNYRRHRNASQRDSHHHRSGSGRNPLPRPPKDVLASTPFRPLLSQLPSTHYSTWGGANNAVRPPPVPMPQPQPAPPPPPRKERSGGGGIFRRRRDTRFAVPSLTAAAQPFIPPGMSMPMPDAQHAPASMPTPGHATTTPVLPHVVPSSAQMQMRMPEPDQQQQQQQQPPVIPPGMGPGSPNPMSMPSPAPAGSTPFIGGAGLTPAVVPPGLAPGGPGMGSGQMMSVPIGASPAVGPMSMPAPGVGMPVQMGMGMPSPGGAGGVVPTVRFNGHGEYSGLLYHSPHTVMYEDELYPTALHLFEALKFLEHRPDLADQIRLCGRVEDVTHISASFAEHTRRDWGIVALATMDEVLYYKFRQHGDLRALLLGTYPA
ncbi:hypothetical protein BJY52DRAFT_840197 [Lactarius psammicola]|nr:hypothetical protein BJY52DRAFT_840197 [Lactarius psammicola]